MSEGYLSSPFVLWVLTYLVHSTILLGSVWLWTKWGSPQSDLAETGWKLASVGSVITSTLCVVFSFSPLRLELEPPHQEDPIASSAIPAATAPAITPPTNSNPSPRETWPEQAETPLVDEVGPLLPSTQDTAHTTPVAETAVQLPYGVLLLSAWGLGLSWLFIRGQRTRARFRRLMRERRELKDPKLRSLLTNLMQTAEVKKRIRLTTSDNLVSPVSFGIWRPEICIPLRCLRELEAKERQTMLAHELAHVVRRDALWTQLLYVLRTVFFFQPLNRVASRHLLDIAELRCDAWAARETGEHLALASCLTRVAQWLSTTGTPPPVPCMAHERSPLGKRIHQLLEETPQRESASPKWTRLMCVLPLAGLILLTPQIGAAEKSGELDTQSMPISTTPPPTQMDPASLGRPDALDHDLEALLSEIDSLRRTLAPEDEFAESVDTLSNRARRIRDLRDLLNRSSTLLSNDAEPMAPSSFPQTPTPGGINK